MASPVMFDFAVAMLFREVQSCMELSILQPCSWLTDALDGHIVRSTVFQSSAL